MRVKTGRYKKPEDKDTICLLCDSGEIKSEIHFGDKMRLFFQLCAKSYSKGPVKLIKWVKIAHSFLQSVSNLFHFII